MRHLGVAAKRTAKMKSALTLLALVAVTGVAACSDVTTKSTIAPSDLNMTPENSSVASGINGTAVRAN